MGDSTTLPILSMLLTHITSGPPVVRLPVERDKQPSQLCQKTASKVYRYTFQWLGGLKVEVGVLKNEKTLCSEWFDLSSVLASCRRKIRLLKQYCMPCRAYDPSH